jgi:hypothetical protein
MCSTTTAPTRDGYGFGLLVNGAVVLVLQDGVLNFVVMDGVGRNRNRFSVPRDSGV